MVVRELWHNSPINSVIKTGEVDEAGSSKILIKSLFSLVSTGTETLVSKGLVPPELWQQMQVPYMDGSFAFPVKYGYSLVGEVIKGEGDWPGKKVHLMHPHQDFAWVLPEHVTEIPKQVPAKRAVLASVLETAVNAVWDSGVTIGDVVLVNGFGIIGAVTALVVSQIPGTRVVVYDPDVNRQAIAKLAGATLYTNAFTNGFDIAFNASAKGEGLQFCIDKTRYEGTIVELSWYGTNTVGLNLGTGFHVKRQRIISSQVSQIPGNKLNRWDFKQRKGLVFDLLKNPVFDVLLTTQVSFNEAPTIFNLLRQGNVNDLCITFTY